MNKKEQRLEVCDYVYGKNRVSPSPPSVCGCKADPRQFNIQGGSLSFQAEIKYTSSNLIKSRGKEWMRNEIGGKKWQTEKRLLRKILG